MCSSPHWQVGQSWFREKLSLANREQRLSRCADFAKNCLPRIGSKVLPRFCEKYRALGRQKNGVQHATAIYPIPRYTRPRYIGLTLYILNDVERHHWWRLLCCPMTVSHYPNKCWHIWVEDGQRQVTNYPKQEGVLTYCQPESDLKEWFNKNSQQNQ